MVVTAASPNSQAERMGQQIPHPASTNYYETPAAKRIKHEESTDSSTSDRASDDEHTKQETPVRHVRSEIPDSDGDSAEEEGGELGPSPHRRTGLENALPPVKTDKEAIADYEAVRAAEHFDAGQLQDRLGQRKWTKGKSSIYVDAFNLALQTVLEDEGHLFDEVETAVFEQWRSLSYEAQYLYVRLFLRKTAAWHRVGRLGYYSDIADLPAAVMELQERRALPVSSAAAQSNPGELAPPTDTILEGAFTFADGSEEYITTLEEAANLLLLDELKVLAKEAKVQGKNKGELIQALRKVGQQQSGLSGWRSLKRSDTEESVKSETSGGEENDEDHGATPHDRLFRKVLSNTGDCIRLTSAPQKLFERVHLVFYRSTEWTEKSLTTIILARISKRNFPDFIVSRSTNIFPSRSMLLEFEAGMRTQFRIDTILEFSGTVNNDSYQKVKDIAEEVYPRWRALVVEEQHKEDRVYESGEGAYLRRFSPAWVYTRIVHKGLGSYARFKEHKREHTLLVELLDQHLFHASRRGSWYQRKALLEEHYMWALEPDEGRSEDAQKRHWKKVALRTCEEGLEDKDCHLIFHYDLQKRIVKLEKSLKVAKRLQHDFGHVLLAKPEERTVSGIRVEKRPPTPPLTRRNSSPGAAPGATSTPRRGGKTIWIDEHEGGGECSVEAMCLSEYRTLGWKGYHSEGGILRTLFGLLFHDVLFTYVPNVFQTPYQTCPLDLHSDAFYPARFSEIAHLLARLSSGDGPAIFRDVHARLADKETCIVGVDWSYDPADLEEILDCFPSDALAAVCKVMAQEYGQRGGGIPDLFLWRRSDGGGGGDGDGDGSAAAAGEGEGPRKRKGEVMFAEVKSENDRLSDTQRLWIHVLAGAGVRVELCNAVAREVRVVKS